MGSVKCRELLGNPMNTFFFFSKYTFLAVVYDKIPRNVVYPALLPVMRAQLGCQQSTELTPPPI